MKHKRGKKMSKTISATEIAKLICQHDNIALPNSTAEARAEGKRLEENISKLAYLMEKGNFEIFGFMDTEPYKKIDGEGVCICVICLKETWEEIKCNFCERYFCPDCFFESGISTGRWNKQGVTACECCLWSATESEADLNNCTITKKEAKLLLKINGARTPPTLFKKIDEEKYISYKPDLTNNDVYGWNEEKQEWEKEKINANGLILPELPETLFSESEEYICEKCNKKEGNCRCMEYDYESEDENDEEDLLF